MIVYNEYVGARIVQLDARDNASLTNLMSAAQQSLLVLAYIRKLPYTQQPVGTHRLFLTAKQDDAMRIWRALDLDRGSTTGRG